MCSRVHKQQDTQASEAGAEESSHLEMGFKGLEDMERRHKLHNASVNLDLILVQHYLAYMLGRM